MRSGVKLVLVSVVPCFIEKLGLPTGKLYLSAPVAKFVCSQVINIFKMGRPDSSIRIYLFRLRTNFRLNASLLNSFQ